MNIQGAKLWKLTLVALSMLVILGLSLFGCIKYYLKYKSASEGLLQAEKNIHIYATTVKDLHETNYEARLDVVEVERKLQLSQEQEERLKAQDIRRVHAIGRLELDISSYRDSLQVYREKDSVKVPVEIVVDGEGEPMLPLPASFGFSDEWLTMQAVVDRGGMGSISFEMEPVALDITLGSRGLWQKSYISAVSTNNPHVQFTENNFQMVSPPKRVTPIILAGTTGVLIGGIVTLLLLGD